MGSGDAGAGTSCLLRGARAPRLWPCPGLGDLADPGALLGLISFLALWDETYPGARNASAGPPQSNEKTTLSWRRVCAARNPGASTPQTATRDLRSPCLNLGSVRAWGRQLGSVRRGTGRGLKERRGSFDTPFSSSPLICVQLSVTRELLACPWGPGVTCALRKREEPQARTFLGSLPRFSALFAHISALGILSDPPKAPRIWYELEKGTGA